MRNLRMRNLHVLILTILMVTRTIINAQNNLEIIEYFEAVKIISTQQNNTPVTPVIVVIDKGVNLNHEDLINNIWCNSQEIPGNGLDDDQNGFIDDMHGWNFADNTNDVSIGGIGNWHGTPVNGIIGADSYNEFGIRGICPKVKLMNLVKGESTESITNSLRYVYHMRKTYNQTSGQKGAYIVAVNCSWGKDSLWASDYSEWCALYDSLGSVGVLSIHSVPNDNIDVDLYGDMPTTCSSNYLITVTNSNQFDEKVFDAGFGKHSVDLAAPGDNSYTTLNPGNYGYFGGTSAAAPYVTGFMGMMYFLPSDRFQEFIIQTPSETASIIKSALFNGVDNTINFESITVSGGRLNAFKSLNILCDYYGEQHFYKNLFEPIKIISVYPNPASLHTSLQIECSADMDISINIAELGGKNVFMKNTFIEKGIGSLPIDISELHNGFYIIHVTSKQTTKSSKLIIQ